LLQGSQDGSDATWCEDESCLRSRRWKSGPFLAKRFEIFLVMIIAFVGAA
jgi:hypothetical protein